MKNAPTAQDRKTQRPPMEKTQALRQKVENIKPRAMGLGRRLWRGAGGGGGGRADDVYEGGGGDVWDCGCGDGDGVSGLRSGGDTTCVYTMWVGE